MTTGELTTESDRPPHVARRLLAVASALTLVATLVSGAGWLALTHLTGNITTIDVAAALGDNRPTKAAPVTPTEYEPLTILVMGTDTRTGQGSGFGDPNQTASGLGHSDTTIVLHIAGDRSRALGVSIPRDSWVTRPRCDGTSGTTQGKFNAAFAQGGPACTIKLVESLTGVRMDHFVVVDFKGFKSVVDALGGVPICLANDVNDVKSGLKLSAGTHLLNGDQALAFARARKTLGDGSDIARIDRQQEFLSSVVRTATSKNVLTNLPTLYSVLDAVTSSLTTDTALGDLESLKSLALSLQGLTPAKVKFMTVPWKPKGDGANVVWDTAKADPIWQAMKDDTAYPPAPTTPPGQAALTVAPNKIKVEVLNGTGVSGKGREAADQLTALGYTVTRVATAPTAGHTTSTVSYAPDQAEAARTLVWSAHASSSTADGSGGTLTLVVGTDWTPPRDAVIAPAPKPSSSHSASASPSPSAPDGLHCVS